ncbi:16S rRNA (cytidine(1402)-2'-O)-methyltransferase [Kangiella sediminilitoris]|uniref:Ribosomal RNA small subunit methyltransferase I n=1 Tax=Kangiella sediminilitoris TaxID=1144748 RepID=A0A1B3BCE3_9GAMM|nr:16S rRNA (cytidine(1402)-2'-O)-methyltransferase [Kangiella sediminilitoris]AOE50479.1 16S rRNA methyltransferase [Kangiella sediminilitoris]
MKSHQVNEASGILYVVATPIGNIDDMSYRAVTTLQQVNLICAEDTRHSQRLMEHYAIKTPMMSLHEHNEQSRIQQIMDRLESGDSIALISDAGTPLISDPGFKLVRELRDKGYKVSPIPGPSAIVTALSVAGLATDSFSFWGFLPAKSSARKARYSELAEHSETLVFYESSHRIVDSLKDLLEVLGDRTIAVARELTKNFETIISSETSKVIEMMLADSNQQKGEFVLIISGNTPSEKGLSVEAKNVMGSLLSELPPNKAAKLAAQITGTKKKELYQWALEQKDN